MSVETLDDHVRHVFARELGEIRDETLRERTVRAWVLGMEAVGATNLIHDLCLAGYLPGSGIGVEHMRAVSRLSLAAADILAEFHGITIDRDVVAAGALLHDVGKLLEHAPADRHVLAGPGIRHAFSGMCLAKEAGLPQGVLHAIACHSPELQRHPRTQEAEVVYRADMISFDALCRRGAGRPADEFLPYVYLPKR